VLPPAKAPPENAMATNMPAASIPAFFMIVSPRREL
jgi:hypothetical protein